MYLFRAEYNASISKFGIISGEDSKRFHENMIKNENHIKTNEEIEDLKRRKENYLKMKEKWNL